MTFEGTNVKPKTVTKIERDFLGRGNDDMKSEDIKVMKVKKRIVNP